MKSTKSLNRINKGFTLVELFIVIAIIAILAGLLIPSIWGALRSSKVKSTRSQINALMAAIESYKVAFGSYPPTSLEQLANGYAHGTNSGIEALVMCLTSTSKGEPFYTFKDKELINSDQDTGGNITSSYIVNGKLFECVDAWDQPLIYLNSRDYTTLTGMDLYQGSAGMFSVKAATSETTGTYQNSPVGVQIWSIGADGENENGSGDDVNNWSD